MASAPAGAGAVTARDRAAHLSLLMSVSPSPPSPIPDGPQPEAPGRRQAGAARAFPGAAGAGTTA